MRSKFHSKLLKIQIMREPAVIILIPVVAKESPSGHLPSKPTRPLSVPDTRSSGDRPPLFSTYDNSPIASQNSPPEIVSLPFPTPLRDGVIK